MPFFEPQLVEYIQKARAQKNIKFECSDFPKHFEAADCIFICVNTPPIAASAASSRKPGEDLGQQTDMSAFNSVVRVIAEAAKARGENEVPQLKIIVNKSTVPIGTA